MVKLTDEQKAMLEALDDMPDEEIDYSDIPRIIDWSGFRMGLFYRPMWKDMTLSLDEFIADWFRSGLADGETLDEAVNMALSSEMYRIKFPVRVEHTEELVRRIKRSPEKVAELTEWQKDQIKALYNMPVDEVASSDKPLKPTGSAKANAETSNDPAIKEITLKLDENVIDWFEEGLEEGQSRDHVLSKTLLCHIHRFRFPEEAQRAEEEER